MAVTVYETDVPRFVGRFAVSNKESPGGGSFEGELSADGKYVVWTFTRRGLRGDRDRDEQARRRRREEQEVLLSGHAA